MSEQKIAEEQATVLRCKDLKKHYQIGPERLEILTGLDLAVDRGEMISIIGASGSGKSTLLNLLGALDQPTSGTVELVGKQLSGLGENEAAILRNKHLGFVFQFHHLLPEFTALENIAMPLLLRGEKKNTAMTKAAEILQEVGLEHRDEHKPAELSGGERQRVAIARALVGRPDVLLMDEPTGNLDSGNAEKILQLIERLNQEFQIALVLVTHDLRIAEHTSRCLELTDGRLETRFIK